MKKLELKKVDYRHYVAISITIAFLLTSIFIFPSALTRIIESFRDFGTSVAYYVQEIFYIDLNIVPTVTEKSIVPPTPIFNLPETWEEFTILWGKYWDLIFTKDNFFAYLDYLSSLLYYLSRFLLLAGIPLILLFVILFRNYMTKQNNDYNKDSKALIFHKKMCKKVYDPIKIWLKNFINFIKENKIYLQVWFGIWLWNFNIITIVIEFLAYYFYFVVSFNKMSMYIQFYKLFSDLSVMIAFVPPFAWVLIAYWLICIIRKKIGYARLNHNERKNCGFINERPIVLMVCGTMGKKKTTIITDMALSQEAMLKDKAFEKILENDLKFPYFPWVNLENDLKQAIKRHEIYNLATIKKYIRKLAYYFELGENYLESAKSIRRWRNKNGYKYKNLIFDYDYKEYGLYYDDKLKITYIWDIIETYAQLYFIYVIQSSLIISNYSIRTDNLMEDLGNFPMWNTDFFKKDSRLIDSFSRHSHIVDFDALRLGQKLIKDNKLKDSFEFGVINLTEVGKERKNNLELKELKKEKKTPTKKMMVLTTGLKWLDTLQPLICSLL